MKKLFSILMAAVFITAMSVTALAATPPTFVPDPGAVRSPAPGADTESVPVYGYIGPELEEVIDPGPEDPDINPFALNISVPVKLLWVAFVPEEPTALDVDTDVFAPDYKIINRTKSDVNVTVTGFEETTDELDSLTQFLDLKLDAPTDPDASGLNTAVASITPPVTYLMKDTDGGFTFANINLGTVTAAAAGAGKSSELWFTLSGTFSVDDGENDWPTETLLPQYLIKFKFAIAAP